MKRKTAMSHSDYLKAQDADSSWNHISHYGDHSARNFITFGGLLQNAGRKLTSFVDFGGNDGTSAFRFSVKYGIEPTVIDCDKARLDYAGDTYGLPTTQCLMNDIPLKDNSFDYGFCNHVVEHLYDPTRCMKEMNRVVRHAVYFVMPMETKKEFEDNSAHVIRAESFNEWKRLVESCGFLSSILIPIPGEAHVFARC